MNLTNYTQIPTLDAQLGDRYSFIAAETSEQFGGLILARELNLVQVRWGDGHESWTPLEVHEGTVEVYRNGKSSDTAMAIAAPGANHQGAQTSVWR